MTDHLMVLCTCPDQETGERLAEELVMARLAACVNIVPGLTSIYRWEGETRRGTEVLLLAKTRADRYAALEQRLVERHPYELPEVIAVSLDQGLAGYLAWIDATLGGGS
jgi:periplasmic divalent cation tolerance protein